MAEAGPDLNSALHDFWRARRRANMNEALSFLRRGRSDLLNYDEVRRKLRAVESSEQTLEEVPLDRIVGSVGRYNDFTRGFLPKQDSDKERWAGVLQAMTGLSGTPPVELYRIGDAYFVRDGNHRVSVARQLGSRYIQAYVTPVHTKVPLGPDTDPDDLIIKSEYADFLLETGLDLLRPGADLTLTAPGKYEKLLEHISVHRYYMGIERDAPVPYSEAVTHWYDEVYLPVVESIRRNGLLRGFPGRTQTDLYLWLAEHRGALEEEFGWSLPTEAVVQEVAEERTGITARSDEWREELLQSEAQPAEGRTRICEDILVALPDLATARLATAQALLVAEREESRLYGLHVQAAGATEPDPEVARLQKQFDEQCRKAGRPAQFAVDAGPATEQLLERAPWSDLVVAPLPTGESGEVDLNPGFRSFLRRCPRPVLTLFGEVSCLSRALVAFDGGERSRAALFVGAYLALRWKIPLVVLTVAEATSLGSPLENARAYLDGHGVEATLLSRRGRVPQTIVEVAREFECDALLMGSYKYSRWLETMLGGVLEETLRLYRGTVLVT